MKRLILAAAVLVLAACRSEEAALPDPVAMTEEAVGHYCQMNLFEHPGPKAQIHLDGMPDPIFFSQVRDGVAFERMPEQSHIVAVVYVNDMGADTATWAQPGAENWIRADDAFYVVGSRLVGGMGAPELVPFADEVEAAAFAEANGGRVTRLGNIPDSEVLAPVALDDGHHSHGSGDGADYRERLDAFRKGS